MSPILILALAGSPVTDQLAARAAVGRSLPLIQRSMKSYAERASKGCVACHHQGYLFATLGPARERGYPIDEDLFRAEADKLHGYYVKKRELYGEALTDADAMKRADNFHDVEVQIVTFLSALDDAGRKPDDATAAAARLLAHLQKSDGCWSFRFPRVPIQSSDIATTAMAVRVLRRYGPDDTTADLAKAKAWLLWAEPKSTDDKAYRLEGLARLKADAAEIRKQAAQLLAEQRRDGGWAQEAGMTSDAYATALVLLALHGSGGVRPADPAYRRGARYLSESQKGDGSWFVKARAVPDNTYFESGFPHGKSQFISFAATCLATRALLLTVPPPG